MLIKKAGLLFNTRGIHVDSRGIHVEITINPRELNYYTSSQDFLCAKIKKSTSRIHGGITVEIHVGIYIWQRGFHN